METRQCCARTDDNDTEGCTVGRGASHLKHLGALLTALLDEGFGAARVVRDELCDVYDLALDGHPAVLLGLVLGELIGRDGAAWL